jgi:hypothetical protein
MKMILLFVGLLALSACTGANVDFGGGNTAVPVDCDTNTAACNPVYPDGAPK